MQDRGIGRILQKTPSKPLAVAVEIYITFCLIGAKPGEGLSSSKLVSKLLLGGKTVTRKIVS